jgi:iron transport multicopper oxidase
MPPLLDAYLNPANINGAEPVPNSTLINDSSDTKFSITPGLIYHLRIISFASFAAHYVQLGDHEMTIIAVDSVNVVPQNTFSVYVAPAQRYDVLFKAKKHSKHNYAIISSMDQTMFDGYPYLPQIIHENATAYLVYNPMLPLPAPLSVPSFSPYDDFNLVPLDKQEILGPVDTTYTVNMIFNNDENGINR